MNLKFFNTIIVKTFRASLYNNAFYLMLNTTVGSALGFIFWDVVARCFSHADVGIGTVLLSASGLIVSLANLGLGVGLIRYIPEVGDDCSRLNNTAFTLTALTAGMGAFVYLLFIPILVPALRFVRASAPLLLAFLLFAMGGAIFSIQDQSLIAGCEAKYVFWKNALSSIIKLPLPVIAFAWLGGYGIYAGTEVAILAAMLLTWFVFMPRVYPNYSPRFLLSWKLIAGILPYSFCNYLASLLNAAPSYVFPLLILNVLGPEQSAFFYMAWMMGTVIDIIPSSFTQSLLAEGAHDPGRLGSYGRQALAVSLLLSLLAMLVMIALGRWILHFFGAAYAENGIGLLRCLVVSIIPACLNGFYCAVNQIKKRVGLIVAQSAFASLVSLGLGYWLLKTDGLTGLGLACALTQGALALIIVWPLWNDLKTSREVGSLVPDRG
jgi:O-antigen/teichoic acid export membrane protein